MTGRAIATLGLTIALSALLCAQQVPPPPPPNPPPEGAPITPALSRLLVIAEAYPQLRSDATFARLMDELAGTENRLATARMRYNESVQEYDTQRQRFPSNLTAKVFGFKEHPYFQVPPEAKVAPRVDFGK